MSLKIVVNFFTLMLIMSATAAPWAAETPTQLLVENRDIQRLDLGVGKSKVLDTPMPIKRASLANPEIADTVVLSPTQIYLTGKTVGVTSLTLWQDNGKMFATFDVVVSPDLTRLKENLYRTLPDEQGIQVTANHEHVTLAGTVSNTMNLTRALGIAEAYAPKKVTNLLQVGGVQQVMLEVRVAEMNRELIRRLGVNLGAVARDGFGVTALNQLTTLLGGGNFFGAGGTFSGTSSLQQECDLQRHQRAGFSYGQHHLDGLHRCPEGTKHRQSAGQADIDGPKRPRGGVLGWRGVPHSSPSGIWRLKYPVQKIWSRSDLQSDGPQQPPYQYYRRPRSVRIGFFECLEDTGFHDSCYHDAKSLDGD